MRVFTTLVFLAALFTLFATSAADGAGVTDDNVSAFGTTEFPPPGEHEEFHECGTACPDTCQNPHASTDICTLNCVTGNFCVKGYVRDERNGRCVLPNECLPRVNN